LGWSGAEKGLCCTSIVDVGVVTCVLQDPSSVDVARELFLELLVVKEELVKLCESAMLDTLILFSRGGVFVVEEGAVRVGFRLRSGCTLTKLRKLISVLGSGIFQGKRRKVMQRKIMAMPQTSAF
jgi:hypothetical protein